MGSPVGEVFASSTVRRPKAPESASTVQLERWLIDARLRWLGPG